MPYSQFPEPPTEATLRSARHELSSKLAELESLTGRIATTESALAEIVSSYKRTIAALQQEKSQVEQAVAQTRAYVAPIRRLPDELVRVVFNAAFDEYACAAWVLSGVCRHWRRLTFAMPRIWSKIRLVTTQHASADTIRLWLERSGSLTPLDIEIFLQVGKNETKLAQTRRRRTPTPPTPFWHTATHPPAMHHLQTPVVVPPSPPMYRGNGEKAGNSTVRTGMHWGHIAVYYLVEQMHRWERFVFRFEKQFASILALKSILGDAPLLKEFEVSCAEPAFYSDWLWLPSAAANSTFALPNLDTLTLRYMPFKWSSPMFRTNLTSLTLHALPTGHFPLDRILHILSANPGLISLSIHFAAVIAAILPLSPVSLPRLANLSMGGHYLLSQLLESLIAPTLEQLTLDIEARDPIEDTITNLLVRSNNPPLTTLAVAYGGSATSLSYYGSGIVISWTFLAELRHLRTLRVGGTPFEPLLGALADGEDWLCPALTGLAMKSCHTHGEGVKQLVQMVAARNPDAGAASGAPVRLQRLELYECASIGTDVVAWLEGRIDEVVCTEPTYDRQVFFSPVLGE
ncbi:hypothetical protein PLICRDRAFT_45997 [Plicaturopsis crispa FD-325 SS-3]|uniref:F-box domain-containing protein n=1 Tax=Plicaturopsis crispa FD-325 SS-3 TaxID=944288 RepID=A0A0C9SRF6_PLICR|nr:hypothetical protein PLICRDRAFT_45997 [Plicaturopsis crispa FD-325 SS-3]